MAYGARLKGQSLSGRSVEVVLDKLGAGRQQYYSIHNTVGFICIQAETITAGGK